MGRKFVATFEKVAVSAVQDLLTLIGKGTTPTLTFARLMRFWAMCVDNTPPTAQMLALRVRRLPATITNGSGGSVLTAQKLDDGDTATACTVHANDTTKTTTSGTPSVQWEGGCYLYQGSDTVPSEEISFIGGQAMVFELITTPGSAITLSGGIEWEEFGPQP